jgi:predicted component of type VI protein secretion system
MRIFLTLINGEQIEYNSDLTHVTIGRSQKCDLVIQHEAMSRTHCKLEIKDGELYITDLGSINGVYIDGERIPSNSSVPFQTFLHLSFGAVTSAQVEIDEVTKIGVNLLANQKKSTIPNSIEVIKKNIPNSPASRDGKNLKNDSKSTAKGSAKKEKQTFALKFIILVTLIIALYFFFYKDHFMNSNSQEDDSSQIQAIENKDDF